MTRSPVAAIASLAAAVAELQQLDSAALSRRWRALVGGRMPPDLGRPLTLRILAYKLQAQQWGDLDRQNLRELSVLYEAASGSPERDKVETAGASASPIAAAGCKPSVPASMQRSAPAPPRLARPGTLLAREYGGVLHRIIVLEQGVTWNGRTYDSLSQVALAITGTKWNGPRFFGLRDRAQKAAKTPAAKAQGKLEAGLGIEGRHPVIGRGRVPRLSRSSLQ